MTPRPPQTDRVIHKKAFQVVLEDVDLIELHRVLINGDEPAAHSWLRRHLAGVPLRLPAGG